MIATTILGAGAAGLFAAKWLRGEYLIVDHAPKIASKIAISGGGRCNLTNATLRQERYKSRDPEQMWSILRHFDNDALLAWVRQKGCSPILRKKNQYFCPKSARELIDILRPPKRRLMLGATIEEVRIVDGGFAVITSKGVIETKTVLVATGGLSYKKVGASGVGFEIARRFGHEIVPLRPALVGLTPQPRQFWFKELSGIGFEAQVRVAGRTFHDGILFAHRGLTGPAILNASLWWEGGEIEIAFLPALPKLDPKKQISTQIPLPRRFVKRFLQAIEIEDRKVQALTKEQKERLKLLCGYRFAPAGTFGYERAEVTSGGVRLCELKSDLQSRLVPGLFFAGEVIDVTGELGGYNFQWAFSSAYRAARGIEHYLRNL